jgi:hypothetical protein
MFLTLYLPLFIVFTSILAILFLLLFSFRGHDSYYKTIESSRAFIAFAVIQMSAIFGIDYFNESLYNNYNFIYIFIVSSIVFACIYFPILNLVPSYSSVNRFFLSSLFALLSLTTTEFSFFSIYSAPFSAWSVFFSALLLITIISGIIIVYTHFFSQSTEQLLPFE